MNAPELIKHIKKELSLTSPQLGRQLGYKCAGHIWFVESGTRQPSILMCKRLIWFSHDYLNMNITIDELLGVTHED